MPKKKSWFTRIKDLFFPVTDEQEKKKKKKRKKLLYGWMRTTKRPPSLAAPSASEERTENKALKEEMNLPVAAPGPSDGAGASTSPRFGGASLPTSSPTSTSQCEDKAYEHQTSEIRLSHSQLLRHVEDLAAIKIQTAFRGYLARKALRALKGLVRLQAIIRGRAVRRQAVATLKSLQSIVSIHSQVCAARNQVAKDKRPKEDGRDVQDFKDDRLKIEVSNQYRRWDDRLMTKEEENAVLFSKTEAMMRRNRIKAYSFNHRHSADQWEEARRNGRLRSWLEEHNEEDVPQMEEIKMVDTIGGKQMRQRSTTEAMLQESPAPPVPRRPLHRRRSRPMSDGKMEGEPAYMAATESARARARPTSCSPRLRPMQLDCYSDGDSPYKIKLTSPMSSINSERTCNGGLVNGKCMVRSCKGMIKLSPKPYFDS